MGTVNIKPASKIASEKRQALIREVNQQRKAAEAKGIRYNGVRYAGSPEDRQALAEAIDFARDAGLTSFTAWKDSDGRYHSNHPLSDVEDAYRLLGQNRMRLIQLEGQFHAQVGQGILTSIEGLDWS